MSPLPQTLPRERILALLRERPARTAILCDIDGTLAPIVERPEEASVPAATRGRCWRPSATGSGWSRASRAAGPRRRGGWSGSTRSPTSATTGSSVWRPGRRSPRSIPAMEPLAARVRAFAAAHFDDRAARRRRAARGQGRDLGLPLARRSRPRRRPRAARARSPRRRARPGLVPALGAHGARDPPHRRPSTRAPRSRPPSPARGLSARALRRRRHDRPRRLPPAARAPGRRGARARRSASGWRRRKGPAEIADEADLVVDGPDELPRAARPAGGLIPAPLALHRLPQVDRDADGRRGDRAGGRHGRGRGRRGTTRPRSSSRVAWWTLAALIGAWLGRRNETTRAIGRLLAQARSIQHAAGDPARWR